MINLKTSNNLTEVNPFAYRIKMIITFAP